MKSHYISLHYWDENHIKKHKKKVGRYLDFIQGKTKGLFLKNVYVFFNDKIAGLSNGHVFVSNIAKSGDGLEDVLKYLLSKDRSHIPITISCHKEEDSLIKKILKENYGSKGKLTNGFLGMGKLSNQKTIKIR